MSDGFRGGWSTHSLSDLGRIRANLLADRLGRELRKVDAIIASDLPRASETAEILGKAMDVPVSLSQEWREVNNGVLAGMPNDQADTQYPGIYWPSLDMDQAYPGGESPRGFYTRIASAFDDLRNRMEKGLPNQHVMIVTQWSRQLSK